MKNYLQAVRLAFSRNLMRHLAARLGESENAVGKALKGMVPMVLCQLVIQTAEGQGRELFTPMVKPDWSGVQNIRNLTEVLALLGGGLGNSSALDVGEGLLVSLFGANRPALDSLLSSYAGLRLPSAGILLRLVAAVLAAGLAQHAGQQQLTAHRLGQELADAKNRIYAWIPDDFPRWPGFRQRTALRAPHAVWAAELARPYWMLVLAAAGGVILSLLVLEAVGRPAGCPEPKERLLISHLSSEGHQVQILRHSMDSTLVVSSSFSSTTW